MQVSSSFVCEVVEGFKINSLYIDGGTTIIYDGVNGNEVQVMVDLLTDLVNEAIEDWEHWHTIDGGDVILVIKDNLYLSLKYDVEETLHSLKRAFGEYQK